jgi:glyoxylate/hydroxypyruvate reductase
MTFLYKADPVRGAEWARLFAQKAPDLPFHIWPELGDPLAVRYLAAWEPPAALATTFPNLGVLFCTGAGVDHFDLSSVPASIPVVRMIEPGIAAGMVEYVTLAVLAVHRDWFEYRQQQQQGRWAQLRVRPAASRRVGVLGLGVLGKAVLNRLLTFGFGCAGWSRSKCELEGIDCYAGANELPAFLSRTDILVCLLPLTDSTRGMLDRKLFDALPAGAVLINAGRGGHVVQQDLLQALDTGKISTAILDVTDPEPLPSDHPFWKHPRVMLTPHIASMTQPETAAEAVLANILRHRNGEPLIGQIDRGRGY